MKKYLPIFLGIFIAFLVILPGRIGFGFINVIEDKILDFRFLLRGATPPGDEVIIIAIDEKTLDEIGRWPFPRSYFVDVVDALHKAGVSTLGFDMVFSEPDIYSGVSTVEYLSQQSQKQGLNDPKLLEFYDETKRRLDNDYHLSMALSGIPEVVLGYFFHLNKKDIGDMKAADIERNLKSIENRGSSSSHTIPKTPRMSDLRKSSLRRSISRSSHGPPPGSVTSMYSPTATEPSDGRRWL
jgi:adenylate cyclase